MYQDQFNAFENLSDATSTPRTPSFNSLTDSQKIGILSFAGFIVLILLIILLKQCGEWIGYKWAIRNPKTVVGVAVLHRQHSTSVSEDSYSMYHDQNEFRGGRNLTFTEASGNTSISGIEMSAIDRIMARQSNSYPRNLPNSPTSATDIPPAYDEALHHEKLHVDSRDKSDSWEPDCPPPSYWNLPMSHPQK